MKLESIGEVIAARRLSLANAPSADIVVLMGKPQPFPDDPPDSGYYCPIQIMGVGSQQVKYAGGVDAFQALELGLRLLGIELAVINRAVGGTLRWEGEEEGDLGFPFPDEFRASH
jgi:hypothetical protein